MQHDILGELQLDENINMILPEFFGVPHPASFWVFFIFECIKYDIAFNSSDRNERDFWKVYIIDIYSVHLKYIIYYS